jgi:hypothetical protein
MKTFKQFIKEDLPFDSYPGPGIKNNSPANYINSLYPKDDDLDHDEEEDAKHGYGFSFPYYKNGPFITRFSGDNTGQIGIRGGVNGGRIGGEFDLEFSPGGEIKNNIPEEDPSTYIYKDAPTKTARKERILNFLQQLNKK